MQFFYLFLYDILILPNDYESAHTVLGITNKDSYVSREQVFKCKKILLLLMWGGINMTITTMCNFCL